MCFLGIASIAFGPLKFGMHRSNIGAIVKVVTNGGTRGGGRDTWDCVSRRIFHDLSEFPAETGKDLQVKIEAILSGILQRS